VKLDETRVTIRERSWLEILDLALRLCAEYWRPLSVTFLLGALPLAIANDLLVFRLVDFELDEDPYFEYAKFLLVISVLVFLQAPLASVFVTSLLGRIMFHESPDLPKLIKEVLTMAPRWIVSQGILRGSLLSLLLMAAIPAYNDANKSIFYLLLAALATNAALLRSVRPFLNEVILLERPTRRSGLRDSVSLSQRMRKLHLVDTGDLIVRFIGSVLVAIVLSLVVVQVLWFVSWVVDGGMDWGPFMIRVCAPASMWFAAAFFSVVRFLEYLDRRTRNEGWSVSLQLRAESQRMNRQWS